MFNKLILLLSLSYVVFFIMLCIISQFKRFDFSLGLNISILVFLTISLSIIAFFSTDGSTNTSGWDINRYYADINKMRGKDISYAFKNGLYKDTVLTNLLFFIVSRLNNNAWLQTISTLVSMSIFSYIVIDDKRRKNNSFSVQAFYILIVLSVVTFSTIMLGVRWILAVSFCVLGKHLGDRNFNIKSIFVEIVCCFISLMFHYGIILYLFIRLVSLIRSPLPKYFLCSFTFLLPFVRPLVAGSAYLTLAYDKIIEYSGIASPDYRLFIAYILLLICFIIFEFIIIKKDNKNNFFGKNFIAGLIGSVSIYHLFARTLGIYVLARGGIFAKQIFSGKNLVLRFIILFMCAGLLAYQLVFMKTFWRFTIL